MFDPSSKQGSDWLAYPALIAFVPSFSQEEKVRVDCCNPPPPLKGEESMAALRVSHRRLVNGVILGGRRNHKPLDSTVCLGR